jgi:hypothetical protein
MNWWCFSEFLSPQQQLWKSIRGWGLAAPSIVQNEDEY